jgi:hypothetical protein
MVHSPFSVIMSSIVSRLWLQVPMAIHCTRTGCAPLATVTGICAPNSQQHPRPNRQQRRQRATDDTTNHAAVRSDLPAGCASLRSLFAAAARSRKAMAPEPLRPHRCLQRAAMLSPMRMASGRGLTVPMASSSQGRLRRERSGSKASIFPM